MIKIKAFIKRFYMKLEDFNYYLPEARIAKHPLPNRSNSKLLYYNRASSDITDKMFYQLTKILNHNDLLVFNNTKVLKARLLAKKVTGAKVECLIEKVNGNLANCLLRGKNLNVGQTLIFDENFQAQIIKSDGYCRELKFNANVFEILDKIGNIPIPPYFNREATKDDNIRYQTVYANKPGAIAAPTAGLHFDQKLLTQLEQLGVQSSYLTLHVGLGTFKPVNTENIHQHVMHSEYYEVDDTCVNAILNCKAKGGRVIAVGTTVVRTLETIMSNNESLTATKGASDLFITPGFKFKCVDGMITNFHLPKSTLLMLVSAFIGHKNMQNIYRHALSQDYRFFSYGDAMLLL